MSTAGFDKLRTALVFIFLVWVNVPSLNTVVAQAHGFVAERTVNAQNSTDKLVDNLINRALKTWPRGTDMENTTLQKKRKHPHLQRANQDMAYWKQKCDEPHVQISAQWRLLFCSDAVIGELKHEVTLGVENESEYSQALDKTIANVFIAGVEFAAGPFAEGEVEAEGEKALKSAWKYSSKTEKTEQVSCEVFGGNWCLWQWHMTFSQCDQVVHWDAPLTECSLGMDPPKPLLNTHTNKTEALTEAEKAEPDVQKSAILLASHGLTKSCLYVLMGVSLAVVFTYLMLSSLLRFFATVRLQNRHT